MEAFPSMAKPLPTASGLPASRYRLLIEQLLDEPRSTQVTVAAALGTSQGNLSKLRANQREAGIDLIELACTRLKLQSAFFFDRKQARPRFRDYRVGSTIPAVPYPALTKFLELTRDDPNAPNEAECHALELVEWDGEPTPSTYALYLQALRTLSFKASTETRLRVASQR